MYVIHKQLIPIDTNMGDPNWAKRQVWVLKLNSNKSQTDKNIRLIQDGFSPNLTSNPSILIFLILFQT